MIYETATLSLSRARALFLSLTHTGEVRTGKNREIRQKTSAGFRV